MKRLVLFILAALFIISSAVYTLKILSRQATYKIMGTEVSILIRGKNVPAHIKAAINRMREIEKLLNRYDEKSEVSRINRGEKFKLSNDTIKCLALAEHAKKLTGGAFDVYYSGKLNLDGIGKGYAVEEARRLLLSSHLKT
jgi:thiamine biosynthesis lipoprotein